MAGDYQAPEVEKQTSATDALVSADWAVVVIAAREDVTTLSSTINAAIVACAEQRAVVDVVINGNRALAASIAEAFEQFRLGEAGSITLRIWSSLIGDKSHAWNQYVHDIWPGSEITYFVDGYARPQPDAFSLIAEALEGAPESLAGTGVPSVGRSASKLAQQMIEGGGIHGNMHAIRGTVIEALRERNFRLPLGLYRGEATVGAVLAFRLDPANHRWVRGTTVVQPEATWWHEPASIWSLNDLIGQLKRRFRQARGTLENRAVRQHLSVSRKAPEDLPATADEFIGNWIRDFPGEARSLFFTNPLCWWEARKAARGRDWSQADTPPELLLELDLGRPEGQ